MRNALAVALIALAGCTASPPAPSAANYIGVDPSYNRAALLEPVRPATDAEKSVLVDSARVSARCRYEAQAATVTERGLLMPALDAMNLYNLCVQAARGF